MRVKNAFFSYFIADAWFPGQIMADILVCISNCMFTFNVILSVLKRPNTGIFKMTGIAYGINCFTEPDIPQSVALVAALTIYIYIYIWNTRTYSTLIKPANQWIFKTH